MMRERLQLLNEATILWQALVPVNEKKDEHILVVSGLAPLTTLTDQAAYDEVQQRRPEQAA